jgi:hypothetical protein
MFTNTVTRFCAILATFTLLCKGTVFSQLQNEGVLGASFYGETMDSTGSIRNQVGPNADFAVPVDLSVNAELLTLSSGTSTKLVAAIQLDDNTLTQLSGNEVQWQSLSIEVTIVGDQLTVGELSEKKRVSVSGTSHGFTDKFFIILNSPDPVGGQVPGSTPGVLSALENSTDLQQEGWKNSNWFGNYYDAGNDWIHHLEHGWLFTSSNSADSIWLWSSSNEWLWTGPGVYPHLFRNKDSSWLYFIRAALPRKIFYNHTSKTLEK